MDNENNGYCLGSETGYAEQYLARNHIQDDAHYRPQFTQKHYHYHFWDHLELKGNTQDLYQMAADFGQGHTMAITKHSQQMTRCYHFSSDISDDRANQRNLEQLDAFHAFIDYFDEASVTRTEISDIFFISK